MSDKGRIKVLFVRPRRTPEIIEMDDSLEVMQELVGGDIEEYMPFDDEVAIVCNAEGKLRGETLNRAILDPEGNISDIIAGKFFICYAPIESEKFLSMPDDLMEKYEKRFHCPELFGRVDGEFKVLPGGKGKEEMER